MMSLRTTHAFLALLSPKGRIVGMKLAPGVDSLAYPCSFTVA